MLLWLGFSARVSTQHLCSGPAVPLTAFMVLLSTLLLARNVSGPTSPGILPSPYLEVVVLTHLLALGGQSSSLLPHSEMHGARAL